MKALEKAFGIDLRTLALFRVMLAVAILADLANRARDLTAHYTDAGVLPRADLLRLPGGWRPSFHLVSGSTTVEGILFALAAAIALALLVGYRTRLATILSWLFLASLQARNPVLIQGGDNLLLLLLFWGIFLPLGARFSIDAALTRGAEAFANGYLSVVTAALLVQCMSVYFFSALLKSGPEWWPDGTAVQYALHIDYLATPFATWFRQFTPLLTGLTYYVWFLELVGPIVIFLPFLWSRLAVQWMLITMHIGFALCLEIGLFPLVSITSLLAFTPGWVWDRLAARMRTPERAGLTIHYDGDCDFCRKVCLILRTMLLLPGTPILKAQDDDAILRELEAHNSWVVVDHDGARAVRWQAVALVFRRSPLLRPVGALFGLPALARLGDRVYEWVARNRARLGRFSAAWLPYREEALRPSAGASVVVAGFALLVLWINLATLPGLAGSFALPGSLNGLKSTLVLGQKWNMFAPAPGKLDGWYVVRGETADRTVVDVLHRVEGEPTFTRPALLSREYPTFRWRKYLTRLAYETGPEHWPLYAQYLCRTWDAGKAPTHRLAQLWIYYNNERIRPDDGPRVTERVLFHVHHCVRERPAVPEKVPDAL